MQLSIILEYLKDDGKIIIVDFMFLNEIKRKECRDDLWEVIDYKYYANVEDLEKYVSSLGCKIHCEHIVNFTWILEIEK